MDSGAWNLDLCAFPEFALHERQSTPALSGDDVVVVLPSILTQDASPAGSCPVRYARSLAVILQHPHHTVLRTSIEWNCDSLESLLRSERRGLD